MHAKQMCRIAYSIDRRLVFKTKKKQYARYVYIATNFFSVATSCIHIKYNNSSRNKECKWKKKCGLYIWNFLKTLLGNHFESTLSKTDKTLFLFEKKTIVEKIETIINDCYDHPRLFFNPMTRYFLYILYGDVWGDYFLFSNLPNVTYI